MPEFRVVCAWCGTVLRDLDSGSPEGEVSHGMCARCAAETGLFDVENLYELTAAEHDRLPLGIVELDAAGTVRRYNQAEERLSGRERSEVIGRHFFREVAPCTYVHEFAGRYRALVEQGERDAVELAFIFRFAGGDRHVAIRLTYDPSRKRGLVLVRESP